MLIFDSRSPLYRKPFGAIEAGCSIHLKIRLPRNIGCKSAKLIVYNDFDSTREIFDMFWCGEDSENSEWWELDYTPVKPALYFYHFELDAVSEYRFVGRSGSSRACLTDYPEAWQLTVYEKGFKTPNWLAGGIIYQIFPDSFCKSGDKHSNVPDDRTIEPWGTQPFWQQEHGVVTNKHYFGGDLNGIRKKLDYIASLGVNCIYLNPIFEAHENHRYSTANYEKIDPMLGDNNEFKALCREAKALGIRIILDGVFSHTGADSVYFNRFNRYKTAGAYNSQSSPYYNWYSFNYWPNDYKSWWGFSSLPELVEESEPVLDYITGKRGIVQSWLESGASGWRLDVADELPDVFIDRVRAAAKSKKRDSLIIGEVWEDASNKSAYSKRRRYLLGKQLDSVMNYPFKNAIIGLLTGMDAGCAADIIYSILENYPPQVIRLLMNMLGTHDTERALSRLAGKCSQGHDRAWQAAQKLSDGERGYAKLRYRLATVLQYTLPGVPSIYYGDEAGLEGLGDPFNRECYPWGSADNELIQWHCGLADMRSRNMKALSGCSFELVKAQGGLLSYIRSEGDAALLIAVNAGDGIEELLLPERFAHGKTLMGNCGLSGGTLVLPQNGYAILSI